MSARFKIVLLGEGRVGKTSILLRYTRGEFSDRQVSTLQASYLDKTVMLGSTEVNLSIWDTAGQERFHALGPIYYRDADGALLVYDITDVESFKKVQNWVRELRKIVGNDITIAIAGNKVDLEKNRRVQESEAIAYAESVGAFHFQTSAKMGRGLEEVFKKLSTTLVDKKGKSGNRRGGGTGKKLVIIDDQAADIPQAAKGGCAC
jgi:Ras-related protein Rab-21